eukprot:TRINITY_DN8443_c0_g1_i1.p1 TRINITY_DN8443_c0_g1~~TRINITY_DN8443_c0_g1_i1.p1  ORF type:complete len:160 (+),score=28.84 TRINITY_DN8443_c0_g1_i1:237-716(+)
MSLVDYASSSDDEEIENGGAKPSSQPSSGGTCVNSQAAEGKEDFSSTSEIKLPDASELLGSLEGPNVFNCAHGNGQTAPVPASLSKKRTGTDGPKQIMPERKLPKGNLPSSKVPPDTISGRLIPPQLKGRSNIVTEDIDRLFVKRSKGKGRNNSSLFSA